MRKSAKALVLVFVALLGSLGLTIGAAFSAAFAFGATALIVPGTGTHNVLTNTDYRNNAVDRFVNPVVGCDPSDSATCTVQGVDYPAEFFPFVIFNGWCPGLQCDTWNESVDTGVTNLDGFVDPFKTDPNTGPLVIFGYSQGGAVVSREMYNLAGLDQDVKDNITVVTIGNINNPRGLFARLGFLPTIPGLNITFGPNLPTDIGIKSVNYSFEYDPVGDAPSYWGNPLAMLNAVAAFEYVHGYYLVPNDNGPTDVMPYGYDNDSLGDAINDPANRQTYQDATFVLIPQRGALPMYQPVLDIGNQLGVGSLVKPLVALVNPLTKLFVNLGYDRTTNPGIPQYLSILPFNPFTFNPVSFSVQFVQAVVQGVQDALAGGASLDVADTQAPSTMSALASFSRLAATETPQETAPTGDHAKTVSTLAAETAGDTSATADADAAKAAADAAAKAAADKAAADQAAADAATEAAAKEVADKAAAEQAAKDAADKAAAEKEATEAAEKEAKAAADKAKDDEKAAAAAEKEAADKAASDKATEAADKARQAAADSAKEAAGGDKSAVTDTTGTTTSADAGAGAESGDKAA
jgi:hypothetical protein